MGCHGAQPRLVINRAQAYTAKYRRLSPDSGQLLVLVDVARRNAQRCAAGDGAGVAHRHPGAGEHEILEWTRRARKPFVTFTSLRGLRVSVLLFQRRLHCRQVLAQVKRRFALRP